MRILIHDFVGHPFQLQLSRELSARGHWVTHAYSSDFPGPKGRLRRADDESDRFEIVAIPLSTTFSKYSPVKRLLSQRQYARDVRNLIDRVKPDVVLSGNTPVDVQAELMWHCRRNRIGFVHWIQDVYYKAIHFFLQKKVGKLAGVFSFPFRMLEQHICKTSDAVIAIAAAFGDLLTGWGVPEKRIHILENWAPLDEMKSLPRQTAWGAEHGLNGKTVFLYSGTLGLKHRPDLLYRMAEHLPDTCKVVVITEGLGRTYLEEQPQRSNLLLLDFQPYEKLPEVLATADVLLATLEADAGQFAVPSKVLTYLCAGRPILLAAPSSNLASTVLARSEAGLSVNPDEPSTVTEAASLLADNPELRTRLGRNGREYAERAFDIRSIATSFEEVLLSASRQQPAAVTQELSSSAAER